MAEGTWWHEGGCCEAVVLAVWSGHQLVRNAEAQATGHRPRGGISNLPSGGSRAHGALIGLSPK